MYQNTMEIKSGDHVIIKRQGYTKLHKMKAQGTITLGKFRVKMDNAVGQKYFDTFQMKNDPRSKGLYVLEKVEQAGNSVNTLTIEKSGIDNRDIVIDGESQALTKDDLEKMENSELNSNAIISELVSNSKTFNMKTGYSQEKYIKKKEKKYFEYIQILRPTIRLLTDMFYRQDPTKILGLRIDDLSQILTYANIHPEGNHLLYDSGTSGLMPAAITNALGPNTRGTLIHMHPGNECQKNAFIAMQFPDEQRDRCIHVNLYSVLRCFYQSKDSVNTHVGEDSDEPPEKKFKLEENEDSNPKKPQWQLNNERACKILQHKCDTLIITAKEHPLSITKELLPFLNVARQLVVFNSSREPLQDLFLYLKGRSDVAAIKMFNSFLRYYQVLPERTHPEVNMTNGGYVLSAVKLDC